jgi:hypothetical protein
MGWDGTDVFLWAGIPFVVLLLFRQERAQSTYKAVIAAGLLFGALCAIRHASVFLGVFAFLVLLQVRLPDYKGALKRFAVFIISASILIVPTYLYLKLYATSHSTITDTAAATTGSTIDIVMLLDWLVWTASRSLSMVLGYPMVDQVLFKINVPWIMRSTGTVFMILMLLVPFALMRRRHREGQSFQTDLGLSVSLLMLSLPAFLAAADLITQVGFLGVRRYYEPLALCGLLIFYAFATVRLAPGILSAAARIIVLGFVINLCVYLPAQAFMQERNGFVVKTILGYVPSNNVKYRGTSYDLSYPSVKLFSNKESCRQKIKELSNANPDALFFIEEYAYFVFDGFAQGGPTPGTGARVFPRNEYWHHAYTSAPLKVFWVVNDDTELDFLPKQDQQLVYIDPVERTKIIGAEFPGGYRFQSNVVASR